MQGEKVVKKTEVKEMAANKYTGTQTDVYKRQAESIRGWYSTRSVAFVEVAVLFKFGTDMIGNAPYTAFSDSINEMCIRDSNHSFHNKVWLYYMK